VIFANYSLKGIQSMSANWFRFVTPLKLVRAGIAALLIASGGWRTVSAWSAQGHQAVGLMAEGLLRPDVKQKITAILGSESMARASLWPDQIREAARGGGPLKDNFEAKQFNMRFKDNDQWHFVNLPLATTNYNGSPFARTNDIVQTVRRCIDVLEGKRKDFTKKQALRLLIHHVGDLHQPLHVACGYYRIDGGDKLVLLKRPSDAFGRDHDRGGNQIFFGSSKKELHSYWDNELVRQASCLNSFPALAAKLRTMVPPSGWQTSGPIRSWPAQWVTATIPEANAAYEGIRPLRFTLGQGGKDIKDIGVKLPDNYTTQHSQRILNQLAKAGYRLAEVLNAVQWGN